MKKFKEVRMSIVMTIFLIIALIMIFLRIKEGAMMSAFVLMGVTLVLSMMMSVTYNHIVDRDFILIYALKYVVILPTIIDANDIQSVSVAGRYTVNIEHGKRSRIYVFNPQQFVDAVNAMTMASQEISS